jgi:tRNA-specific 2-thiouridylase
MKMNNNNQQKKVYVGVSGGVDSSVALALLKEEGYDVTGVFLKVWSPDFLPCTWREERRSAMRVCAKLGVPFKTLDCEKEYKEKIVDYMIDEYKQGRTPNPDVFCNKYIKFGIFLDKAMKEGADFVATGHYAKKLKCKNQNVKIEEKSTDALLEATDKEKDQSYFLSMVGQGQLQKILLPIGHLKKSEVRELARKFDLPTSEKKDSQGLCFIGKVDMKDFLKYFIEEKVGDVLNENGEVVGKHNGSVFYTIGERFSLSIKQSFGERIAGEKKDSERLFVVSKDMLKNTITVSPKSFIAEKNEVLDDNISIKNTNWISGDEPDLSKEYDVCFRYHQKKQKCKLKKENQNSYTVSVKEKQSDIAEGQIAVFYDGEVCLGGGEIQ